MTKRDNNTVIFDSNIWIGSITKSDRSHYDSLRLIARYTAKKFTILIPIIVVIEIMAYISRNEFNTEFKNTYLYYLQSTENYSIISLSKEESVYLAKNMPAKIGLRAFDYYMLLYCRQFKPNHLETFDKELQKAYNNFSNKI